MGGYVTRPRAQVSVGTGEFGTLGGSAPPRGHPGGGGGVRNLPSRASIRGDWRTRDPGGSAPPRGHPGGRGGT